MSQKIQDTFDINIHFTVCEIMLGLNLYQHPLFYCINYLILMGKWYINKVKNCKKKINFTEFLIILKCKLHVLHNIYNKKKELNTSETHFCTLYGLLWVHSCIQTCHNASECACVCLFFVASCLYENSNNMSIFCM